jgi:hypothetical protein
LRRERERQEKSEGWREEGAECEQRDRLERVRWKLQAVHVRRRVGLLGEAREEVGVAVDCLSAPHAVDREVLDVERVDGKFESAVLLLEALQ